jgi:cyclic pyranopterin phosphate synthase
MSDDAHGTPPAPTGQQPAGDLTHVRPDGTAHMVDVTGKAETSREAAAQAVLTTRPDVVARLVDGTLPKGEALGTARISGIMAAKQTPTLIPLCHPLPLGAITVDFDAQEASVTVVARVRTRGVTGVEMEALTAATVAALTLFDMIKAVDHLAVIGDVKVLEKSGGKSGAWSR